jgi:hypothetical protein
MTTQRGALTAAGAALSLLLAAGCEAPGAATSPPAALVTLGTLRAAYQADPGQPLGVGLDRIFAAGFPPAYFLRSADEIRVAPAYTQGRPSAYMTTDIWVNFPVVWVQPMYVFVSGWDGQPAKAHLHDVPPILSVGPGSAFFSPFWRVYYVEVPSRQQAEQYRSVRQILNDRLRIFPGPGRLTTVLPASSMGAQSATEDFALPALRPALPADPGSPGGPSKIGQPRRAKARIDGSEELVDVLEFGDDRFEWNDRYEVLEAPLFFFFRKDSEGAWVPITELPRVGGTGPLFARRPAVFPGNRPLFGSLWRLWAVHLPLTARLFVPPAHREVWEARDRLWGALEVPIADLPEEIATRDDLDAHAFKVLANESCLHQPEDFPDRCAWLDSQQAIETHLPTALFASEVLVHCPYLAYAGAPVPFE